MESMTISLLLQDQTFAKQSMNAKGAVIEKHFGILIQD